MLSENNETVIVGMRHIDHLHIKFCTGDLCKPREYAKTIFRFQLIFVQYLQQHKTSGFFFYVFCVSN